MKPITSYEQLDKLGRVRLSPNFYMRDFLFSEIAAWYACRLHDLSEAPLLNVPEYPDRAIEAGKQLCVQLLEPLQATFGRLAIRSGYRSPAVNEFGNKNKLNCGSNESNYGGHVWDHPDSIRNEPGAMACIVVPWFEDRRKTRRKVDRDGLVDPRSSALQHHAIPRQRRLQHRLAENPSTRHQEHDCSAQTYIARHGQPKRQPCE